jgi:hypothetical protein
MASSKTIHVVSRASDGSFKLKEFETFDDIAKIHDQIGIDDCSTDLTLRGLPLFRGLVGPLSECKTIVRYESADVFEAKTKEWAQAKTKRRRRRRKTETGEVQSSAAVPAPNIALKPGSMISSPTT